MIRDAAALKLARQLFAQHLEAGLMTETGIELAATLIKNAVAIDEAQQQIERNERALAVVKEAGHG